MQYMMLLAVFVPIIGSFFLPLIGKVSENLRNLCSLLLVLFSLTASFIIAFSLGNTEALTIAFPFGIGNTLFTADYLSIFMACVASLVGSIIILYSFGYIEHYENRNEYYFMVTLFLGAMMGIVFASNLIVLYTFWEITALACWRLIGFFRKREYILRADKAFLITVFGALMMLVGFLEVFRQTGSFDYDAIKSFCANGNTISTLAVALILFGVFSKSATLPLHTWLPDAGVAPSPVTALLHAAVLVKIGVYVFARLFVATMKIDDMWHTIVPIIAGASALISAAAAMIDNDMKRIIAYSTVSQIAFIFLGLSIGNETALAGGLLYILMHSIAKGGLFLCAGIIEHKTHTKDIRQMGGLARKMPITTVTFLFCAFSVMGIPPFGGFFSKYLVLSGTVSAGQTAIAMTFLVGAFLTIMYLFRLFTAIFMGELKTEPHDSHEGSISMLASVIICAILSLGTGLFINGSSQFVNLTVQQMMGMVR